MRRCTNLRSERSETHPEYYFSRTIILAPDRSSHDPVHHFSKCGGLMVGDVIVGVGSVSFWTERSLSEKDVAQVMKTATHALNVKVAATSAQRILQERHDSSSVVDTAPRHSVTCGCLRESIHLRRTLESFVSASESRSHILPSISSEMPSGLYERSRGLRPRTNILRAAQSLLYPRRQDH